MNRILSVTFLSFGQRMESKIVNVVFNIGLYKITIV